MPLQYDSFCSAGHRLKGDENENLFWEGGLYRRLSYIKIIFKILYSHACRYLFSFLSYHSLNRNHSWLVRLFWITSLYNDNLIFYCFGISRMCIFVGIKWYYVFIFLRVRQTGNPMQLSICSIERCSRLHSMRDDVTSGAVFRLLGVGGHRVKVRLRRNGRHRILEHDSG